MPTPRIRFDRPRRRLRMAVGAMLVAAIVAIVGLVNRRSDASVDVAHADRSAVAAAPAAAPSTSTPASARQSPQAVPAASKATPDPCADGFADWEDPAVRRRHAESAARVVDRHVATLMARGDDMSVAVAQLILMLGSDASDDTARQALARLAGTTTDPKVYLLAVHMCRGRQDGNCQTVTPEQWARLDPSNAMAWLYVADAAFQRRDPAGADMALRRASEAGTADIGAWILFDTLFSAMPARPDAAMLDGSAQLGVMMFGIQAAWSHRPFYDAVRHCSAPTADASRRDVCLGLAEVLANRSRDLMERRVGIKLAGRLGWPADRVTRQLAEIDALIHLRRQDPHDQQRPGCASRELYVESMRDLARHGEAGMAERKLAASGLTLGELVERDRERRQAEAVAWAASQAASAAGR